MRLEQALFTSARTRRSSGYQLVARSAGVSDQLAETLRLWGPSHGAFVDESPEADCLSCFPTGAESCAVARTLYGGPEYSGRGGLQLVTRFLLVRNSQLAGYRGDALLLARTALALGRLRLTPTVVGELPLVELPDTPPGAWGAATASGHGATEVAAQLLRQRRLALVGVAEPWRAVEGLLSCLPESSRGSLSFTTGLRPSAQRPFRLHVYRRRDPALLGQLRDLGVETLE